jgi:DNA-binding MarR family transcriptional regulator
LHAANIYGTVVGVPAKTLPSDTATGQDLVVALFGVARRLKSRLPQSHLDPAMMYVLHQVQANGSLRVSELASCMGLDASTASRHVRQLEDGGADDRATLATLMTRLAESLDRLHTDPETR